MRTAVFLFALAALLASSPSSGEDDRHLGTTRTALIARQPSPGDAAVEALVACRAKLRSLGLFPVDHNDLFCGRPGDGFFEKDCLYTPQGAYEINTNGGYQCQFSPPGSKQKFHWGLVRTQPGTGFSAEPMCEDGAMKDVPPCRVSRAPRADFDPRKGPFDERSPCGHVAVQMASELTMAANQALRRALDVSRGTVGRDVPEPTAKERTEARALVGKLGFPVGPHGKDESARRIADELSDCFGMPGYGKAKADRREPFLEGMLQDLPPAPK